MAAIDCLLAFCSLLVCHSSPRSLPTPHLTRLHMRKGEPRELTGLGQGRTAGMRRP